MCFAVYLLACRLPRPPPPDALATPPRRGADRRRRSSPVRRARFRGYDRSSIARSAQVSPNLITRYFGGKDGLFLAASDVRFDLAAALDGPQSSFGERVAHTLVSRWAELGVNDPLPILLRSAGGQPTAASALADFLSENAIGPMSTQLLAYGMSREDAAERAAAVHALVVGVVFIRRVLHSTALDTMDDADLERSLGRSIQALIDH